MQNYNEMNKQELRTACKAAGISYGKMANSGMRDALAAKEEADAKRFQDELNANAKVAATRNDYIKMAKRMDIALLDSSGVEGHCPHCGIDLGNGWCDYSSMLSTNQKAAGKMQREFICLACNGEFGPMIQRKAVQAPKETGIKIEKDREERNGVKRPSAGGKCRAVWDALDQYQAEEKEVPTASIVKMITEDEGWNPNNATIEFYQWRKFHGIGGRSK
jgi:hypothetical protein